MTDRIECARGLSQRALLALADLEARVVATDGGRLKLEWPVLRGRSGRDVNDFLWWEGDRLVGFLGLYAFGLSAVEIAGMVDPGARRRGIATALLEPALAVCRRGGHHRALLVIPGGSSAGRALAAKVGAVLEHSEHALQLLGAPTDGPSDDRITMRPATAQDIAALTRVLTSAFGEPPSDLHDRLADESSHMLAVEFGGAVIGTIRVTRDRDTGRVYGFAVDPAWQGRGIGRDVLRRVCRQLREQGARSVGLEAEVDNDRALALYTSLGFQQITTEDYYALTLPVGSR